MNNATNEAAFWIAAGLAGVLMSLLLKMLAGVVPMPDAARQVITSA